MLITIGCALAGLFIQFLEGGDPDVIWERVYFQWTGIITVYLVLKITAFLDRRG